MGVTVPADIAFIGTSESSGISLANGASSVSSTVDVLGANADGMMWLSVNATFPSSSGQLEVTLEPQRTNATDLRQAAVTIVITANSSTVNQEFGPFPIMRYDRIRVANNGGGTFTNVAVLGTPVVYA